MFNAPIKSVELASALRRNVTVESKNYPGLVQHKLMLAGRQVGMMDVHPGVLEHQIVKSHIDGEVRGLGLGKKLYGEAMRRAPNRTLRSDSTVSDEASHVWESMKRRPKSYAVETATRYGYPVYKAKLTGFQSIVKRSIQFRAKNPEQPDEKRSALGKVAAVLGTAAAVGGAAYVWKNGYRKTIEAATHSHAMRNDPSYRATHMTKMAETLAKSEAKRANHAAEMAPFLAKARGVAAPAAAKVAAPAAAKVAAPAAAKVATTKVAAPVAPAAAEPLLKIPSRKPFGQVAGTRKLVADPAPAPAAPAPRKPGQRANPVASVKEMTPSERRANDWKKDVAGFKKVRPAAPLPKASKSKGKTKKMSANMRIVMFAQGRHDDDGTFEVSVNPLTHYRRASRVVPWVRRAGQTAGDLGDMAAGKQVKDPFYKKSWFKRAVETAAIAAPLGLYASGIHARNRENHGGEPVKGALGSVGRWADKKMRKVGLAAKPSKLLLAFAAHERAVMLFDSTADERGWDLRDARGKSARVYAPGAGKRTRREKTPGERVDNIRLVRNIAIGGTLAGAAGTLIYRNKWQKTAGVQPDVFAKAGDKLADVVTHPFRKKALAALVRTVNFARQEKEKPSKLRTAAKVAGAGLVTAGALALPAAIPMLKIQGRRMDSGVRAALGKKMKNDPLVGGKFVNDYLTSSRRALNRGPQGVIAGKIIQNKRVGTKPGTLPRFMADHYARFRAGDKQALGHWGYEVGESLYQGGLKKGMSSQKSAERMKPFLAGQSKVNAAMDHQLNNRGRNESEALARVAANPDKDVQGYFRRLAAHKTDAVKRRYGPLAAAAPAAIAAGAGLLAASRKKDDDEKSPHKALAAVMRVTAFSRRPGVPTIHRVIDSVGKNSSLPDRPELPGEGTARVIIESPRARSLLGRAAGVGLVTGAGAYLGRRYKRPTLGAALGGFGAGSLFA